MLQVEGKQEFQKKIPKRTRKKSPNNFPPLGHGLRSLRSPLIALSQLNWDQVVVHLKECDMFLVVLDITVAKRQDRDA